MSKLLVLIGLLLFNVVAYIFIQVDEEYEKQAYEMMNFHKEHMREAREFLDPIKLKEKRKTQSTNKFGTTGQSDADKD
jgi:hypothetical protein